MSTFPLNCCHNSVLHVQYMKHCAVDNVDFEKRGVVHNVKWLKLVTYTPKLTSNGHGWVLNDGAEKCRREG